MIHSKQKGNIGEAIVLAKLIELGNPVSLPFGDNERYDLIVESKTGELLKAQVKYSSQVKGGGLHFSLESSKNHTTNKVKDSYIGEVDLFFLYHSNTKDIYILRESDFKDRKTITLRNEKTRNNQTKGINFAWDYVLSETI